MALQGSDLKIAVAEPRSWARRLTITVPAEHVQQERREVARRLARRVRLPGFRQGKVPAHVLEKRFGPAIDQEAIEHLIGEAYREALQRESLQPITQGEVENLSYEPGSDLTFDVEFEIRPEIELTRLGGFTVERKVAEVTEEDVDRVVQRLREQNAVWHPLEDEAPVVGDRVVVEITPLGGEGESAPRTYEVVLGEGQAVESVEEAIRTLKPGEENEFTLLLPDTESEEEGAMREDRARIRLVEAQRPELPELDDDFAKSVGDFDRLDVLRSRIREDLEKEAESEAEREVRGKLLEEIIQANPFDVPESLIRQYVDRIVQTPRGEQTEKSAEIYEVMRPAAEQALRRMMVIERVAELQGLHATTEEVDARVEEIALRNERPVGEVWSQLQKSGQLGMIEEQITEDKVFEYLKSQSTIK